MIIIFGISTQFIFGQDQGNSGAKFIHNDGQWSENIDFKLPLNSGDLFFEGDVITYSLYDKSLYGSAKHGEYSLDYIQGHAYKTHFLDGNSNPQYIFSQPKKAYHNFFIGNDSTKWKSNVPAYGKIYAKDIYEGIDYTFYEQFGKTKYDFIISPEGNPNDIKIYYEGIEDISLKKGHLVLSTAIGDVIEQSPYAYQMIDGKEVQIPCNYKLRGQIVYFEFPEGFDQSLELIIDPVLTFATYTGSSADNFGCTATDDLSGNMYVGGTVFGAGYPTSTGAFQISFGAGTIDMGITKFTADGTNIIYSTYVGGTGNEIPHSLVVDDNDNLIILGTSNSFNYPISSSAFSGTMQAGTPTTWNGYGFNYISGCDIVVTKLNAGGNSLIGSTFIGGSGNDGLNQGSLLHFNYGDAFRGEVINGLNGEIIIASTTSSTNFPVTPNAPQSALNGASDAVLVKFNSNLSSVLFATYLGGSDRETGNSVQISSSGEIYITGGTLSTDFPNVSGGLLSIYQGGSADGYIARFSANGSVFMDASYIGTDDYDQNYFVQLDNDDDVYLIGQTNGTYPILNAAYSNPNSGQYIQKLTPDLSTSLLSTTIGKSIGSVDIAVNAFLVSDCDYIYISGWGGPLDGTTSLGAHATSSSTVGMPITADAFQTSTDGSDFYLAVLGPDASSLLYATFFGGNLSHEHADGGTSRFDKSGTVYQAVCAGCGGHSDFPTTTGAWSNTNNANNCNLGAFKFDLGSITPAISIPQPYVCIPSSYQFNNNSSGGNQYTWYFGDGDSSHLFAPAHTYQDTGHYSVYLIVSDSTGCLASDTAELALDVYALGNASISIVDTICVGDSAYLSSGGGASYQWFPPTFLSNPTGQNTFAFPLVTTEYMVIATDPCGTDTAIVTVPVYGDQYSIMPDTLICAGFPVTLRAYGGVNYQWHNDPTINNINSQTPTAVPVGSTYYYVDITMASGCVYTDSVLIETVNNLPVPSVSNDTTICLGSQINLQAQGGTSYIWSPSNYVSSASGNSVTTTITTSSRIYVEISNPCGTVFDSVDVEVIDVYPVVCPDTTICPGDQATLWASGGDSYIWSPSSTLSNSSADTTLAGPNEATVYQVQVLNNLGCSKTLDVSVYLYPIPSASANGEQFITYGQEVNLQGTTNGNYYFWTQSDSLLCDSCLNVLVKPEETTIYTFNTEDIHGCKNLDTITVYLDGTLYVPNTFTPNGDGVNDYFKVVARDVHDYQLYIFNRWGQLIFDSQDTEATWDGKYKGDPVVIDAYIWKIYFLDNQNHPHDYIGHVNVIR
ncbi:MAG: gliding motility-associated C-terminal domain-containing protein [Flavobacteriales bacterium]|nr:gliding motility-associated C-terminal domain-containing protein [Flavobacteriales bacterium]